MATIRSVAQRGVFLLLILATLTLSVAAFGGEQPEDSKLFLTGFDLYQKKDYARSTATLNELIKKYPDSPLRDMTLFWLSRSYYRSGNQREAARYFSQLVKEYPDSTLKGLVEDEFHGLVARYERGEKLPTKTSAADRQVASLPHD